MTVDLNNKNKPIFIIGGMYIQAAQDHMADLSNNGEEYSDDDYIYNLLRGLPEDYGMVKADILWRQDNSEDEVSIELVERQIITNIQ